MSRVCSSLISRHSVLGSLKGRLQSNYWNQKVILFLNHQWYDVNLTGSFRDPGGRNTQVALV